MRETFEVTKCRGRTATQGNRDKMNKTGRSEDGLEAWRHWMMDKLEVQGGARIPTL